MMLDLECLDVRGVVIESGMPLLIEDQCVISARYNNMPVGDLLGPRGGLVAYPTDHFSSVSYNTPTAFPPRGGNRLINVRKVAALMIVLILAHLTHRERARVMIGLLPGVRNLLILLPTKGR
jgi:hypothetical protein